MTDPVLTRPQRDVLNALQAQPDVWHAPDKRNRYVYPALIRLGLVERSPDGLYRAVKVREERDV
ncbi:hypothetical protein [Gluconobacter thailandicus]|uniref:Uncharacterized protein n=1 Tax=Gluconobacter thailandicus TaxID=257438 RepID=A0AAP9ETZ1_GLUTH|nr:hypothetical protein [Gluconobacter thailandicus]QEH97330.1 hypothetical protein FXF46_14510 [Gluconobacter thailandicus]